MYNSKLLAQTAAQGAHWSGKFDYSSGTGKSHGSQGILSDGQRNKKIFKSLGKVREF